MKFPVEGSRQLAALKLMQKIGQADNLRMVKELSISLHQAQTLMYTMCKAGLIYKTKQSQHAHIIYKLTDEAIDLLAGKEPVKPQIVPPRIVNVLNTPPLHPSRYLTNVSRREGSDSRVYPSKHV